MQPLLRSSSFNVNSEPVYFETNQIKLHRCWDKFTISINLLQHAYWYFLMYYWWDSGPIEGGTFLIIFLYMPVLMSLFVLVLNMNSNMWKCCRSICLSLFTIFQPAIMLYGLTQTRLFFYGVIFVNNICVALPIYLICCYQQEKTGSNHFYSFLLNIAMILYFLSCLSIYPLFMPLQSINAQHLLFKLLSFSMQIIKILFAAYLLIHYNTSHYIFQFYLIKIFEVTSVLCVWCFLYSLDWNCCQFIRYHLSCVCRGKCYVILCKLFFALILMIFCIILVPYLIILILISFAAYYWILFECYIFSRLESFVLIDSLAQYNNEMKMIKDIDMSKATNWRIIYNYLTNIDDSIDYKSRLSILHYLHAKIGSSLQNRSLIENMECIIKKQKLSTDPECFKQHGFIYLIIKTFLTHLIIYTKRVEIFIVTKPPAPPFFKIRDNLLHFYDFENNKFRFKWKDLHNICLEIIGLFIIIPVFLVLTIMGFFICPIVLFFIYFQVYSEEYSNNYLDLEVITIGRFLLDLKLWILIIYSILLVIILILLIDQYKLISIWVDCQSLHVDNVESVQMYHSYIHDYRMIYDMLQNFFGNLSVEIMKYVGMISNDDSVHIPSVQDCKNWKQYKRKESVVCQNYIFEIEEL